MSRSKSGLLGKGVYFAKNASYSDNYTCSLLIENDSNDSNDRNDRNDRNKSNGLVLKNMLMCRVYKLPSDRTMDDIICITNDRRGYPTYIIYYECSNLR